MLIFGAIMVIMMIFRPQGLIDHFEERVLKPAKAALDESCPYTFNYVKVRENPNNKRSKVTGFRFYPVYQPQFRDEELEGKELIMWGSLKSISAGQKMVVLWGVSAI